mmetsp:Transcript_118534/g.335313  ORF Transcript_118534/g.335313 Transcript_118534/m.335313 type:complete len:208 (-) Transcript_118534:343-966(-)
MQAFCDKLQRPRPTMAQIACGDGSAALDSCRCQSATSMQGHTALLEQQQCTPPTSSTTPDRRASRERVGLAGVEPELVQKRQRHEPRVAASLHHHAASNNVWLHAFCPSHRRDHSRDPPPVARDPAGVGCSVVGHDVGEKRGLASLPQQIEALCPTRPLLARGDRGVAQETASAAVIACQRRPPGRHHLGERGLPTLTPRQSRSGGH